MKKTSLLHQELSSVIAGMGHSDMLTIVDAGYPIPLGVHKVDLALKRGVPGFLESLDTILEEFVVEKVVIAEEMVNQNSVLYHKLQVRFPEIKFEIIPHIEYKEKANGSKAIVRTGENVAYSNIILIAGFLF
jgi:D-ribose pyranase